ncbi:MAG: sel1 repeat family protein [Nitrospira sp.]|nr:sel1 repeat family protein [Nitrospira sp.]
MKNRLSRAVTATLLYLCALTALSGCVELTMHPATREWKKQQEEQMRQIAKEQQSQPEQDRQKPLSTPYQSEWEKKEKEQKAKLQADIQAGKPVPVKFALQGSYNGSVCNGKINVEIQITEQAKNEETPLKIDKVYGWFRSFDQQGKRLEIFLRGEYSQIGAFLSLYSAKPITLKEIAEIEYGRGLLFGKENGQRAFEALKNNKEYVTQFEKTYGVPAIPKDDLSPVPTVTLNIDIARDSKGQGWVGSFESDAYKECNEIEMISKSGTTTAELPPVTGQLAWGRAFHRTHNYDMRTYYSARTPTARIYWLRISEREGNLDAPYHIATLYEDLGKTDAQNYQHAFQYYSAQAEGLNDVRIQEKLARLYENGLGTQKNLEKAQQLYRLAGETRKKALHVCTSSPIKNFADAVMKRSQQSAKGAELLLGMTTDIRVNATNLRLIAIEPEDVVSMDKPFACNFFSKRIDPKVDAELVPDGRYIEGPYGDIRWEDNTLDKVGKTAIAGFMQEMAKAVPVITRFGIIPYGGVRYQIVYDSSTRMTVELN